LFPKQAANSLVTETLQYFVFFCRSVYYAIFAKCLIINVLRLIRTILFFIAFLNITYVFRHTWATNALRKQVPLSIISQALGHTSEKTTRFYLASLEQSELNRANARVTEEVDLLLAAG